MTDALVQSLRQAIKDTEKELRVAIHHEEVMEEQALEARLRDLQQGLEDALAPDAHLEADYEDRTGVAE